MECIKDIRDIDPMLKVTVEISEYFSKLYIRNSANMGEVGRVVSIKTLVKGDDIEDILKDLNDRYFEKELDYKLRLGLE